MSDETIYRRKVFNHREFGELRTLNFEGGRPWFMVTDVARALEYRDVEYALTCVDRMDVLELNTEFAGNWVSESGVCSLIRYSKSPHAKRFKNWIDECVMFNFYLLKGSSNATYGGDEVFVLFKGGETPVSIWMSIKGHQDFMGREIPIIEGVLNKKERYICDKTIAEIHGTELWDIRDTITANLMEFKSTDFVDLKQHLYARGEDKLSKVLQGLGYTESYIATAKHIYLLSERGYLKAVRGLKLNTPVWEVYDRFVDEYFL